MKNIFQLGLGKFRIAALFVVIMFAFAIYQGGSLNQWLLSIALYFLYGCVGIAVTFHRYLSHNSFKMPKWRERIFVFIGHLAGTDSAVAWVNKHHAHHKYSDTELDPHSPRNGVGKMVLLAYRKSSRPSKAALRLANDPFYRLLHNYYILVHLLWVAAIYALFGFSGVLFGHFVPVALVVIASLTTNLFGHMHGTQRYDTQDDSKNNPLVALLSWGEGWHNNHHRYPGRANFGEKWWELDISWLVIKMIREKVIT